MNETVYNVVLCQKTDQTINFKHMLSAKETCLISYNTTVSCNQNTEVCVVLRSWAWSILTIKKEYTVYIRTFGFNWFCHIQM